ncbi:MAG: hypothetical protein JWN34_4150 [Bryobacterales bacterium]|nr:hypothetical protein [Bryobacterales bacterium]
MRTGFTGGRYQLRNATMVDLIRTAWGVGAEQVVGGPAWLELDHYDVVATAPAGSTPDTLHAMLRGLLADRFGLKLHRGMQERAAYAITAGKKVALERASAADETGCRLQPGAKPATARGVAGEPVSYECGSITMAAFAQALPKMRGAPAYLFSYPVVDRTGLQGSWRFGLHWSMRVSGPPRPPTADTTTLFEAIEKQLGLRLQPVKISAPVVVVDQVSQTPTPNVPQVTELLPPPRMEFEVATIKLADPKNSPQGSSVNIQPGGRMQIVMTLKELIQEAWNELGPDLISGGPKSMDETRFEVRARAPAPELNDGPGVWNGTDINSMRMMLRALLIERFHLVAHEEARLVNGYVLVTARPKLRRADPRNRPGCKEGPGEDRKDPRLTNPMAPRLVTCRNMTMTEFAAALANFAYLPPSASVADETGLAGKYDLTVNFSPPTLFRGVPGPRDAADESAVDPNGAISLFDALRGQLGLKVESRKVSGTMLVIDHVDEMPVEN